MGFTEGNSRGNQCLDCDQPRNWVVDPANRLEDLKPGINASKQGDVRGHHDEMVPTGQAAS